jgi:hypothetical protein
MQLYDSAAYLLHLLFYRQRADTGKRNDASGDLFYNRFRRKERYSKQKNNCTVTKMPKFIPDPVLREKVT